MLMRYLYAYYIYKLCHNVYMNLKLWLFRANFDQQGINKCSHVFEDFIRVIKQSKLLCKAKNTDFVFCFDTN